MEEKSKETAPDLNYTTFTVKHGGGGIVMYGYQWNGSLVQSDDVTEDGIWMNSEVYLAILLAQIQPNTAALLMTMQIDDDPFILFQKWKCSMWFCPQVLDFRLDLD